MAGKIRFIKKPYIGSSITKPNKVINKLRYGKKQLKVYLIVFADGNDQLEIYHSMLLQQWYYKENPPFVIGIAGSHEEAVELICRITSEAVEKTGKADLKRYLSTKEECIKAQAERFDVHS